MQWRIESDDQLIEQQRQRRSAALAQVPNKAEGDTRHGVSNVQASADPAVMHDLRVRQKDQGVALAHPCRKVDVLAAEGETLIPAAALEEHVPSHQDGRAHEHLHDVRVQPGSKLSRR